MALGRYQREVLELFDPSHPIVGGRFFGQCYAGTFTRTWDAVYRLVELGYVERVDVEVDGFSASGDCYYRLAGSCA
tara:strand:- start:111 stop:338 length:228 start_codon:yes stop_codon:yes gene_type:complete